MFIFFFCLNNVQYVIYGNSANKQWIELNWASEKVAEIYKRLYDGGATLCPPPPQYNYNIFKILRL